MSIAIVKRISPQENEQDLRSRFSIAPNLDLYFIAMNENSFERMKLLTEETEYIIFLEANIFLPTSELIKLVSALELDPMNAMCSPRVTRFPVKLTEFLPRASLSALIHFSCVAFRSQLLRDFVISSGATDAMFLQMSVLANRCGYSSLLSNEVFLLSPPANLKLNDISSELLATSEYREALLYENLLSSSPEQNLLKILPIFDQDDAKILIDLRQLALAHNGTSLYTINFLKQILKEKKYVLFLLAPEDSVEFFKLKELVSTEKILKDSDLFRHQFLYCLRIGQPWTTSDIHRVSRYCLFYYVIFFDTIARDCHYIRLGAPHLEALWQLLANTANGLIFISEFSRQQFLNRYPEAQNIPTTACLLSTSAKDYFTESQPPPTLHVQAHSPYLLIIGNDYDHKATSPTAIKIRGSMSRLNLFVIGKYLGKPDPKIICKASGFLPQAEFDRILNDAEAVIFPSFYEGFGLPIVEALARDKLVFCRRNKLNQELIQNWVGPGKIVFFSDLEDLSLQIRKFEENQDSLSSVLVRSSGQKGENDWQNVAQNTLAFILMNSKNPKSIETSLKRMKSISSIELLGMSSSRGLLHEVKETLKAHSIAYKIILFFWSFISWARKINTKVELPSGQKSRQ